jgi:hypothetical protein
MKKKNPSPLLRARASVLQLAGEGGKPSTPSPIPQFPIIAKHLGLPA